MLVNLTEEEIKELLPKIGHRHRLKHGIHQLKRTNNVDRQNCSQNPNRQGNADRQGNDRQGRKRTTTVDLVSLFSLFYGKRRPSV